MIGGLRQRLTKHKLTGSRRKTLESVITYLENNREHMRYDSESGQVMTASIMDYFMPRADIIRGFVHILDQSIPCRNNPLGVKGVGELGTIGATPAVVNAVADALVRAGYTGAATSLQMPLTPATVWAAMR